MLQKSKLPLILILFTLPYIISSYGDQAPEFQSCLKSCLTNPPPSSFFLNLFQWDTKALCQYDCMHQFYPKQVAANQVVQYYGKWPFYRFLGCQEPASVLFSILNGIQHYRGYKKVSKIDSSSSLKWIYRGFGFVGMNTWIWSTMFHSRDLIFTERMDYFSAYIMVLYSLFMAVVRIFSIDYYTKKKRFLFWSSLCSFIYFFHILKLINQFDYTYNMLMNVITGIIHNCLWFYWFYFNNQFYSLKLSYAYLPSIASLLISLSMLLELFDFPAIFGILDAHALWHASTIFIIPIWYDFFVKDLEFLEMNSITFSTRRKLF